jgi:hypothetical protein
VPSIPPTSAITFAVARLYFVIESELRGLGASFVLNEGNNISVKTRESYGWAIAVLTTEAKVFWSNSLTMAPMGHQNGPLSSSASVVAFHSIPSLRDPSNELLRPDFRIDYRTSAIEGFS